MKLRLFNILITLVLISCSTSRNLAPVADLSQPPSQKIDGHTVIRGESLYTIAWRYGIDFKLLAKRNGVSSPYTSYPGQKLSLWSTSRGAESLTNKPKSRAKVQGASKPRLVKKPTIKKPKPKIKPKTKKTTKAVTRSKTTTPSKSSNKSKFSRVGNLNWRWPAKGRILSSFNTNRGLNKGIDIAANLGEPVVSASAGRVVYAGNGLRGYGLLIIIKHNENYLSAYAHNNKLRVKEGDSVKGGQRIADIGSSGANRTKLHFEIRKNGKPVNPLIYLPKR
mgnify:CR=1 FL=1